MFGNVKLSRPGLALDPVHDGRHKLDPSRALDRESIPFLCHIPDQGIAMFTYTWVNKDSEAGAVVVLFGPGIGDHPVAVKFDDRKVPVDMGFDNWVIEEFSMKQDLKFGKAEISFKSPEVTVEFTFEAYHPPYAYGSNALGCPPYCADDRIEQSGTVKGYLQLGDRRIMLDTFGHRDHSWGTRDWHAFMNYRWFQGQAEGMSVHFWHLHALGDTSLYGYVFKDGLMAEVVDIDYSWERDERFNQTRLDAVLTDDAGRKTKVEADFYAHFPLIPDPAVTLTEAPARARFDGVEGLGWMEVAWPTAYLEHVRANPLYRKQAAAA